MIDRFRLCPCVVHKTHNGHIANFVFRTIPIYNDRTTLRYGCTGLATITGAIIQFPFLYFIPFFVNNRRSQAHLALVSVVVFCSFDHRISAIQPGKEKILPVGK